MSYEGIPQVTAASQAVPWWKIAAVSLASAFTSDEDREKQRAEEWGAAQEQARAAAAQRSKEIAELAKRGEQVVIEQKNAPSGAPVPHIAPAPENSAVTQSAPGQFGQTVFLPGLSGEAIAPPDFANSQPLIAPSAESRNDSMETGPSGRDKEGDNDNAKKTPSLRSRIRDAGLPGGTKASQVGPYRYRPSKGHKAGNPLPRTPEGHYVDRFGNVWQKGPYHGDPAKGFTYEWDVQLSRSGKDYWSEKGRGDKGYINVAPDGTLSH